jgi:2-polyprenyl-6-methoxyphenol hydroxylase-like FAD-dependent oxidoreductase
MGGPAVAIVGAGPVGLFLACLLAGRGQEVVVLERRDAPRSGSRSIGIHPPALEALASAGVAEPLIRCGTEIFRARVFLDGRLAGVLPLDRCPPPFRFVLSLPQVATENILEQRLESLAPNALRRGSQVASIRLGSRGVKLELADGRTVNSDFVVGCDGSRSVVREQLGVEFTGSPHRDHYLMADLPETDRTGHGGGGADTTGAAVAVNELEGIGPGADVAIYLGRNGVVESFPLPGRRRRWVARVRVRPERPTLEQLARIVLARTEVVLPEAPDVSTSAFSAETRLAARLQGERWALAGDAAHVISPIGGQGMNLGWLGALTLANSLLDAGGRRSSRYQDIQRRRARAAARRAGVNMLLGSERLHPLVRKAAVEGFLFPPLNTWWARYFTMRGL